MAAPNRQLRTLLTELRALLASGGFAPGRRIGGAFLLACWLGSPPLAAATEGGDWTVGRSSDVFRSHESGLATRIGGWFNASYEDTDRDGAERSIKLNHLNLHFDTRYQDRWQMFVEVEFEHETDLTGLKEHRAYEVEQVYGRYRWSDGFEIQAGRFNTPFGYWTPIHWTILMDSVEPPIHVGERVTPEQQHGLALIGRLFPSSETSRIAEFRYSAFAGYGSDAIGLRQSGFEGLSGGADVRLSAARGDFVGASIYQQRRALDETERSERSLSLYGKLALAQQLTLLSEYLLQFRKVDAGSELDRRFGSMYASLHYQLTPKYYCGYRFNWGDSDFTKAVTDTRYIHTLTLGYNPTQWLRLKLEFADHAFRESRRNGFRYWAVSIGGLF